MFDEWQKEVAKEMRSVVDHEIVDLQLQKHGITNRNILVSDDGDIEKAVWLPLARIEVIPGTGDIVTVTMPERLAYDKGLI